MSRNRSWGRWLNIDRVDRFDGLLFVLGVFSAIGAAWLLVRIVTAVWP